jgi:hypothetical protein
VPAAWVESLRDVPEIGASTAAVLGALISGPPLAPYGLIRQARRTIFGGGTLYLEAMLCDSELVEAVSKDGIELAHEFRTVAQLALRERVMAQEIPVTDLRAANRCGHLQMSPLLSLEEQLVWAYVSQPDPVPECDRLLADCLLSIVRENRHHILDWAAGALRRLPDLVVSTQAAWLLSELCNALHRETRRSSRSSPACFRKCFLSCRRSWSGSTAMARHSVSARSAVCGGPRSPCPESPSDQ